MMRSRLDRSDRAVLVDAGGLGRVSSRLHHAVHDRGMRNCQAYRHHHGSSAAEQREDGVHTGDAARATSSQFGGCAVRSHRTNLDMKAGSALLDRRLPASESALNVRQGASRF